MGPDSIFSGLFEGASPSSSPGVSFDIVRLLRMYGRPLPIDFLGYVTRRTTNEIQEAVKGLVNKGSVVRNANGLVELGNDKVAESSAQEQS